MTVPGLGFLLNDEMDDFTIKPGVANLYGLIQSSANAIAPNKRPISSMAPTIVIKDDRLFLVLGSPGGATIISTVANIIMGVIDFGLDIQQAVNAPRFHHQWMPDELRLEKFGFSPDTLPLLTNGGYELKQTGILGRCRMHCRGPAHRRPFRSQRWTQRRPRHRLLNPFREIKLRTGEGVPIRGILNLAGRNRKPC